VKELKIPLALDSMENVVRPEIAVKGDHYSCPSCGDNLILRIGEIKKPHFSHKGTDTCSQETIVHQSAKLLVIHAIDNWIHKKEGIAPVIERRCPVCWVCAYQYLPDKVDGAVAEKRLESGYVADVAILSEGTVAAAIEILVTHAVDEEKKKNIGVPFIELTGDSVIDEPQVWRPVTDCFNPFRCEYCHEAKQQYQAKIRQVSQQSGIPIPSAFYRTAFIECYHCHKDILIFRWPETFLHSDELPTNIPKPKTIQYRYSKMAGLKYWVNTCPYCRWSQGDHFLHNEPDSLLFGIHCDVDSTIEYAKDMQLLANSYKDRLEMYDD